MRDDPEPRPPQDPDEALRGYLAGHDAPCPGCGYNLRGLASGTCPECGWTVSLETLTTPHRAMPPGTKLRLGAMLTANAALFAACWTATARGGHPFIMAVPVTAGVVTFSLVMIELVCEAVAESPNTAWRVFALLTWGWVVFMLLQGVRFLLRAP